MRRSVLIVAVMTAVVLGGVADGRGAAQVVTESQVVTEESQVISGTDQRLVGLLVDSACYRSRGPDAGAAGLHARCAISCVRKGHRVALVTTNGDVYMVAGDLALDNNAKLLPMMNQLVVLTGAVRDDIVRDGVMESAAVTDAVASTAGVPAPTDNRRPTGIEEGIVETHVRKGDFREGDVVEGPVKVIEALKVELAPKLR